MVHQDPNAAAAGAAVDIRVCGAYTDAIPHTAAEQAWLVGLGGVRSLPGHYGENEIPFTAALQQRFSNVSFTILSLKYIERALIPVAAMRQSQMMPRGMISSNLPLLLHLQAVATSRHATDT
jgi:hypothetical protein